MREREPKVSYQVTSNRGCRTERGNIETESEARSVANAMIDKDPSKSRGLEVERVERYARGIAYFLKHAGEWHNAALVREGWALEKIRAQEAEWAAESAPRTQTFVATFSSRNYHPDTGQNLRYARLAFQAATKDDAFDLLWDSFGDGGWFDAHSMEEVRRSVGASGKTDAEVEAGLWTPPYYRVSWPKPPTGSGETVTLRVRITAAQAMESELWVAGRCLLHRPLPDCTVQVGAGVSAEDGHTWQRAWSNGQGAGVSGEGLILFVKYVKRADAERAAAASPQSVSIVPGSETMGTYRQPPKVFEDHDDDEALAPRKNRVVISGVFTLEALETMQGADRAFREVAGEAFRAWEALGEKDRERVFGVEIVENRVVALLLPHV